MVGAGQNRGREGDSVLHGTMVPEKHELPDGQFLKTGIGMGFICYSMLCCFSVPVLPKTSKKVF